MGQTTCYIKICLIWVLTKTPLHTQTIKPVCCQFQYRASEAPNVCNNFLLHIYYMIIFINYQYKHNGGGGWIWTSDLQVMSLTGWTKLPYPAITFFLFYLQYNYIIIFINYQYIFLFLHLLIFYLDLHIQTQFECFYLFLVFVG